MAVVWSYPLQPFDVTAGSAVTGITLAAGTPTPAPVMPPVQMPGSMVRIDVNGEYTSTSATPTLTLDLRISLPGTAIASATILTTTPALAISASATAWQFTMKYVGTIRQLSTGSSGNGVIHGQGWIAFAATTTGLTSAMSVFPMPTTAAARTVSTINTNQNNQFDIGVTWSSATGSPSLTVTDFNVEVMG
jgi:hypothetical protein